MGKATFHGKGHEQADLAKLMRIYSDWAHELFPRYTFRDFAAATERVAASKRLRVRGPQPTLAGRVSALSSLLTAPAACHGWDGAAAPVQLHLLRWRSDPTNVTMLSEEFLADADLADANAPAPAPVEVGDGA